MFLRERTPSLGYGLFSPIFIVSNTRTYTNTCRVLGKRGRGKGKGERERGKGKISLFPLPFNLFPKPNYELKMHKVSSIADYLIAQYLSGFGEKVKG